MLKHDPDMCWVCPNCGYIISDCEMQHLKADMGCHRCETKLSAFLSTDRFKHIFNPEEAT